MTVRDPLVTLEVPINVEDLLPVVDVLVFEVVRLELKLPLVLLKDVLLLVETVEVSEDSEVEDVIVELEPIQRYLVSLLVKFAHIVVSQLLPSHGFQDVICVSVMLKSAAISVHG